MTRRSTSFVRDRELIVVTSRKVVARTQPGYPRRGMQPLKAHVKNGRLTLDEPTDLPEGQVVYLQRIDGFDVIDRDGLDDDDRAALHEELEASIAEADSGHTEDFAQVISELRQPR